MACSAIHTGTGFLSATLANVDCQAQSIGAYGYGALSNPASSVSIALTALLTVFVALFGLRLVLGHALTTSGLVTDVLRVGIVLTLATSWPAWRAVGYDLVFNGPSEVASSIGVASGLPGSQNDIGARLQDADDGIVAMTIYGSGRLTEGVSVGTDLGDSPSGIALTDQFAFGMGRTMFLSTTIGSFALVRIGAGILLAIAPLMAGLLLFAGTSAIFVGWLRALAFCALANVALLIVQGAMLAMLYPWLSDVLAKREAGTFTVSAPTELLVLCLAYTTLTLGVLFLTSRSTFLPSLSLRLGKQAAAQREAVMRQTVSRSRVESQIVEPPSRAQKISSAVRQSMLREERILAGALIGPAVSSTSGAATTSAAATRQDTRTGREALGSSYRRNTRRTSSAAQRRDATS